LLLLASCTVGPDYRRPEAGVPAAFAAAPAAAAADPSTALAAWWERFGDARLTSLVERAVRSNPEVRLAHARVREVRALRRATRADLWPALNASAQAAAGSGEPGDLVLGALDALWEIDVFGGVRRAVEAAEADADAAVEARRAVLLALVGEVARGYVELRGLEGLVDAVRRNQAAQQETRDLTEFQRRVGLASDLDVERARAQVAATAAEAPRLEAAREAAAHRLGVLLGEAPAALAAELGGGGPIPAAPETLVVGVPADLLRRRPDLGRAERELAAATARVGVARADLYPRFALLGSVGLRSDALADVLGGGGGFTALGPAVEWPLFAAGRLRANVDVQDARQEQALAAYELALLQALEEVENALVFHAREQVRRLALREAVDANREAAELASRLYANGLTPFLDVLLAQRVLLESESRLVESETAVTTSLIALYVALGGGWREAEELALR
jgi:NodT family efflux transporter outer membrane factor (OMF) lipoprotein